VTDTDTGVQPAALVERRGNVIVITINRPEARNAVNGAVSTAVGDALEQAHNDAEVRAVVITGAGDKSFCAGADLKAIARRENLYHPDHGEWGFAGYVHHFIDKPTIAAVNGTALGGGIELASASDLVVAEESAKFGLPEVKRGLIAGAGGVFRIVHQLPRKVGLELLLTGEPISAAEAAKWGLINQVVPDGTVLPGRPGAGRADHRERAAVGAGQQADCLWRRRRRHSRRRTGLGPYHPRVRHAAEIRGRQGRTAGVRRETPTSLEGALETSRFLRAG
jgi:crotonobetainyl-CoA hydratase